jgi:broad specificity phosphatase PhoE
MLANLDGYRMEGAESRAQVRERMLQAFEAIVAQETGDTVGIVSHTTAIKLLLDHLVPQLGVIDLDFGNTSVTTLVRGENRWEVVVAQDVSHLEGMESQSVPEVEG